MNTKPKKKRRIWIPIVVVLAIAALVPVVAPAVGKWFTSQETAIRDGWAVDVGDLIGVEEEHQIEIRTASADASITVLQLVPTDIDQEGFTYYDTAVQQRIRAVLDKGPDHPEPQLDRRDPSGGAESLWHRGQWSVSVF